MKKIFKELELEVKLAGIFGIIAIIAILVEIILGGFTTESIVAGIKDLSGTIVAVLVFIIAAKSFRKDQPKNFSEYYSREMELLIKKYSPILIKAETSENGKLSVKDCYNLNTNAGALYGDTHGRIGRFCEVSKDSCNEILFSLNYTTFGFKEKSELNQTKMELIGQKIISFLKKYEVIYADLESINLDTKNLNIVIKFKKTLSTEEDAKMLVEIIDSVLMNYLILSGRELKMSNEN